MSSPNFNTGQAVKIVLSHNQFSASNETMYHVASINRVNGVHSVLLLLNGSCVGAIPQDNLKPFKK